MSIFLCYSLEIYYILITILYKLHLYQIYLNIYYFFSPYTSFHRIFCNFFWFSVYGKMFLQCQKVNESIKRNLSNGLFGNRKIKYFVLGQIKWCKAKMVGKLTKVKYRKLSPVMVIGLSFLKGGLRARWYVGIWQVSCSKILYDANKGFRTVML